MGAASAGRSVVLLARWEKTRLIILSLNTCLPNKTRKRDDF